jgi:hypothetical protein
MPCLASGLDRRMHMAEHYALRWHHGAGCARMHVGRQHLHTSDTCAACAHTEPAAMHTPTRMPRPHNTCSAACPHLLASHDAAALCVSDVHQAHRAVAHCADHLASSGSACQHPLQQLTVGEVPAGAMATCQGGSSRECWCGQHGKVRTAQHALLVACIGQPVLLLPAGGSSSTLAPPDCAAWSCCLHRPASTFCALDSVFLWRALSPVSSRRTSALRAMQLQQQVAPFLCGLHSCAGKPELAVV